MAELLAAGNLSNYSSRDGALRHESVKGPMSLLVCFIAECARLWSMQWAFRGVYYHERVKADEAIQSWQDAAELVRLAYHYFPSYRRSHAVEKLEKRATEMDNLLQTIETAAGGTSNRKELVQRILDGKSGKQTGHAAHCVERLREMARELNIKEAGDVTTISTACKNKVAVRAAIDGVAVP